MTSTAPVREGTNQRLPMGVSPLTARLLFAVFMGIAYYAAARVSYAFSFRPSNVAVIWIPAGLLLAALILARKRDWAFALAGAFTGNTLADLSTGASLTVALGGAAANCLESTVAAYVVLKLLGPEVTLGSLKQVIGFVLGAVGISNAVTALLGARVLVSAWHSEPVRAWFIWWVGDGVGMLIVAPVILTWAALGWPRRSVKWFIVAEAVLLFGSMLLTADFVLGTPARPGVFPGPNPYMTFPFLFWAALRFGPAGAATAAMTLAAVTAWHAARGVGFFAATGATPLNHVLEAYAYLSFASLSSLIPAAILQERRTAEENLRLRERQYRELFENNPHPMWIFSPETLAFLAVNDAALHQYGFSREEFLQRTIRDIRPEAEVARLEADVGAGHTGLDQAGVWKHRKKDGTLFDAEVISHDLIWLGQPAKLVLALDVTERNLLQEQLLQSQKMEAVGRLAGGVAHDFNNLLGVIIGYAELGLASIRPDHPLYEKLREIGRAADRAAGLTRQLLAFSRKQVIAPTVIDLNSIIGDLSRMLQRTIGEDIQLNTVLQKNLGLIKADPGQIEQVIMNLAVNARDAMPKGGRLTLETANAELDEAYAREHFPVIPGRFVMLAVSDTGVGMDAATQRRIFEPFFTTKEKDKGTGLGLSTVYGIVKQTGGYVWVYSELGKGATFKVYLPRVDEAPQTTREAEPARSFVGSETILVVEDAEGLRNLTHECLTSQGYRVLVASEATEALKLARESRVPIDLLITDVVLPGLGGGELAKQFLVIHPRARVLYMSGYTDSALGQHGVLEDGVAFLQKPFVLMDLWRKVREVLDR